MSGFPIPTLARRIIVRLRAERIRDKRAMLEGGMFMDLRRCLREGVEFFCRVERRKGFLGDRIIYRFDNAGARSFFSHL